MHATLQPIEPRLGLAANAALAGFAPWSAPDDDMPRLRPRVVTAGRDDEIVAQDDKATDCYLVVSGCLRTVRLMADGRRQIGEFLFQRTERRPMVLPVVIEV